MRWDLTMSQRENDLGKPSDSRRAFQVSDIGLHRTDHQWLAGWAAGGKDRTQGLDLDRVAQAGAGAVGLDVIDLMRF